MGQRKATLERIDQQGTPFVTDTILAIHREASLIMHRTRRLAPQAAAAVKERAAHSVQVQHHVSGQPSAHLVKRCKQFLSIRAAEAQQGESRQRFSMAHSSERSLAFSTQAPSSYPSSSSSSPPHKADAEDDSSLAFGGGDHSQGNQAKSDTPKSSKGRLPGDTIEFVVHGSAGKGATPNYGRRRRTGMEYHRSTDGAREKSKDEQMASNYRHEYAPTSRSAKPLPHHTYFSSPSSSFNDDAAAMAAGLGPVGVGGPRSGLGMGAGMHFSGDGRSIARKKAALIFPGQGSQYVGMTSDIFRKYRAARHVWQTAEEALLAGTGNPRRLRALYGSAADVDRAEFEAELAKSSEFDQQYHLPGETAVARQRKGRLRDVVFAGDQLNLTRAENASPAILVSSLSILDVLRTEFSIDLIANHIDFVAGHGLGFYAALCATGQLDLRDGVRMLRHRGLASTHFVAKNKILFPQGCKMPESIYETWAFANAGSGKGAELLNSSNVASELGGVPPTNSASDGDVVQIESNATPRRRGWKRTQMSGCMIRPGKLQESLEVVAQTQNDIREGRIEDVPRDEVVEVGNINSSLQIVLSGTRVGVSLASDRLRQFNLGARAVNLPVSGPYHSSLMDEAGEFMRASVASLPLREDALTNRNHNGPLQLVSSRQGGRILSGADQIRADVKDALAKPVMWLDSIETMVQQGVQRFICLGPGRACAHLLSKELAHRDRLRAANGQGPGEFEVWSVNTVDDCEQIAAVLTRLSSDEGHIDSRSSADRPTASL